MAVPTLKGMALIATGLLVLLSNPTTVYGAGIDLCAETFCNCPEAGKMVECQCEQSNQELILSSKSLPKQTESLNISSCGTIKILTDSFAHCLDLRDIHLDNLKALKLDKHFFAREEVEFEISHLTLSRIGEVSLAPSAFEFFPKSTTCEFFEIGLPKVGERGLEVLTDSFILRDSNIGTLHKASIYSDAVQLEILNNRIEQIEGGAFDASVRTFKFVGNTIDHANHMSLSVAALKGQVNSNIFRNHSGSPFIDFGPDPVCVPDPDIQPDEENMAYNVVANPELEFEDNFFQTFSEDILKFPGANNVPLGSLEIRGNKVKCGCDHLFEFVKRTDFEHVFPRDDGLDLGALLFQKEFYDTGSCVDGQGQIQILKTFARSWFRILKDLNGDPYLECSNPESRVLNDIISTAPIAGNADETSDLAHGGIDDRPVNDAFASNSSKSLRTAILIYIVLAMSSIFFLQI